MKKNCIMKIAASALLLISLNLVSCNLIVDREFDKTKIAEGVPLKIKYSFYNTFNK